MYTEEDRRLKEEDLSPRTSDFIKVSLIIAFVALLSAFLIAYAINKNENLQQTHEVVE